MRVFVGACVAVKGDHWGGCGVSFEEVRGADTPKKFSVAQCCAGGNRVFCPFSLKFLILWAILLAFGAVVARQVAVWSRLQRNLARSFTLSLKWREIDPAKTEDLSSHTEELFGMLKDLGISHIKTVETASLQYDTATYMLVGRALGGSTVALTYLLTRHGARKFSPPRRWLSCVTFLKKGALVTTNFPKADARNPNLPEGILIVKMGAAETGSVISQHARRLERVASEEVRPVADEDIIAELAAIEPQRRPDLWGRRW